MIRRFLFSCVCCFIFAFGMGAQINAFAELGNVLKPTDISIEFPDASSDRNRFTIENVFVGDRRTEVTDSGAPWNAIGRLIMPNGSWCTATLVHSDLILTAAHCIINPGSRALIQGSYLFFLGYSKESPGVARFVTWFWWGTTDPDSNRGSDWAFGRLSAEFSNVHRPIEMQSLDLDQFLGQKSFCLVGYSGDFLAGKSASVEKDCSFTRNTSKGYFLHNCDSTRGSSGGPILSFRDKGQAPAIVALHVAELRAGTEKSLIGIPYADTEANIAIPVSNFIAKFRELTGLAK